MSRRVKITIAVAGAIAWVAGTGFLAVFAEGFVPTTLRQVLLALFLVGPLLVFGEAIVEGLFQVVAYGLGRILLPLLTLRTVRAENFGENLSFRWYGVTRLASGTFVMSADATSVFGLVVAALLACAAYFALT